MKEHGSAREVDRYEQTRKAANGGVGALHALVADRRSLERPGVRTELAQRSAQISDRLTCLCKIELAVCAAVVASERLGKPVDGLHEIEWRNRRVRRRHCGSGI